jgi:hypothetical protein
MFTINPNEDIGEQIQGIARELFSKYELIVNDISFDLCELEFYYSAKGLHEDPYTHNDKLQLTNGQWYFHGSGIDLTIGDEKENFGGILLRGIHNQTRGDFISGPLKVAKELFQHFGSFSLKEIQFGLSIRKQCRNLADVDFASSTRINLPKREDLENYKDKKYRFITHIGPKHSFPEKQKVANCMKDAGIPSGIINRTFEYSVIK